MTIRHSILIGALVLALAGAGRTEPLTIQNDALTVEFDAGASSFSLLSRTSHRVFLKNGHFPAATGPVRVVATGDPHFGPGQAIEASHPNGDSDTVSLFPNLPFALFRANLHNGSAAPATVRNVLTLSATVDWGVPAMDLKTLGTAGLTAPDKNPGSYVWLAVAEPQSRHGVVVGWLTGERGSGVVFSRVENRELQVDAQIDYGRLLLAPGQTESLETLAIGYFPDARLGLESWADAVAKVDDIHLPPQPVGYCTWYSSPHGGASDEKHLAELAGFAAKQLAPFGFSVVQIDDHWQAGVSTNGPKRNFTTQAANGPFPSGMKAMADRIKEDGLAPGLWFMPFAGTSYDPFFKDHQDWFVRRENGAPYETAWGGTCLDMTKPGARDYLARNVRRIAHDWGFRYFKMDGLWTGVAAKQVYVNAGYKDDGLGDAVFHDPKKTNIEAYRDGLKLIREAAGRHVFFLGCCAPQNMRSYGGAFGLVDAMRIGPDNGANWNGLLRGPTWGSRHYFLNGRVWYNDPDPVYVRAGLPIHQARLICSWVALTGQLNLSSDWLPGLPLERLDILKRTMPSHGLLPRPADLFEEPIPRIWLLSDQRRSPRRDVIGLFNWDKKDFAFDYPLERIGLRNDAEYVAFDYWQNALAPPMQGRLQIKVPAQSCRILAVRPQANHPQLISTSRHITQGIVDVLEEKWDAARQELRGRSQVVGGEPYELRFVQPENAEAGKVLSATVISEDQSGRLKTTVVPDQNGLSRLTITSPQSRTVSWSIRFQPDGH